MRPIKTTIEKNEKTNENGVTIVNELVKLESRCEKEFIWYQTMGDFKRIVCSYKTEKKIREVMDRIGF